MSWWIWSLLMLIALAAQAAQGSKWSLVLTATFFLCNLAIACLSVKRGYGHLRAIDLYALVAAVTGIALWKYTHDPLTALFVTICIDFLGNWLTMLKSWRAPYTENLFTWAMVTIASAFSLLAVGDINSQRIIFPVYEILVNGSCFVLIYNRRQWRAGRIKQGLRKRKA